MEIIYSTKINLAPNVISYSNQADFNVTLSEDLTFLNARTSMK